MKSPDPYRTPTTEIHPPMEERSDLTPPYSPSGRFGRLSYIAWVTVVAVAGQLVILIFSGGAAFELPVDPTGVPETAPQIGSAEIVVLFLVSLITLVISIIFATRRCHDIDISGWWNLLILIPLVNLFYVLFLMLKRGSEGPNRYGLPRETRGWEKVVGIIGIVLYAGLVLIGVLAAIGIPAYTDYMERAGQAGM